MAPSEGDQAPGFRLPGVTDHAATTFDLERTTSSGTAVVLLFYPFDFSPVCTNQLCAFRDGEFLELIDDVTAWAISGDSIYAHWAFADEYGLEFPLLSDHDGSVARAYDACFDELEGHRNVPKRSVIVVDEDQRVQYRWVADESYEAPSFEPVLEALKALPSVDAGSVDAVSIGEGLEAPVDGPLHPKEGEDE